MFTNFFLFLGNVSNTFIEDEEEDENEGRYVADPLALRAEPACGKIRAMRSWSFYLKRKIRPMQLATYPNTRAAIHALTPAHKNEIRSSSGWP